MGSLCWIVFVCVYMEIHCSVHYLLIIMIGACDYILFIYLITNLFCDYPC